MLHRPPGLKGWGMRLSQHRPAQTSHSVWPFSWPGHSKALRSIPGVLAGAHPWSMGPFMKYFTSFFWQYHVVFFTFLILSHLFVTSRLTWFFLQCLYHDFICVGAFLLLCHSKCWIRSLFFTFREEVAYLVCMCWAATHFQSTSLQCGEKLFQKVLSQVVSYNSSFCFSVGVFTAPAITYE